MALYPVGKAQKQVLEALGRSDIQTFQGAEAFFERIGITVIAKREGRASVPVVTLKDSSIGGFNAWGEGDVSEANFEEADLSKIEQWISK